MVILVAGATGLLGGRITRDLLREGRAVKMLVRAQSDHAPLIDAGAQAVYADLKDRASLDRACEGVSTVITTASAGSRGGADTIESVDLGGNRHLIDAATAAGVGHFVFTTTIGADPDSHVPIFRAKGLSERHLRESGMPFTILAANALLDVWVPMVLGGPLSTGAPVTLVGEARRRHSFISMRDVAAFALAVLDHQGARNRYLPLGGPEAVSWRDVVDTAGRVLGRPIPVRFAAPGEDVPGLPAFVAGLLAAHETYDSVIDMSALAREFHVRQGSLEDTLRELLATAAAPA